MGRILAIDYGTKRVGLAVTDPLQIIASALDTVHSKDVLAYLKAYEVKEGIEAFVVGMPKRLDSTDTNATPLVKAFAKNLQKNFPFHSRPFSRRTIYFGHGFANDDCRWNEKKRPPG